VIRERAPAAIGVRAGHGAGKVAQSGQSNSVTIGAIGYRPKTGGIWWCPLVVRVQESPLAKKQPSSIDAHVGSRVRLRRMLIGMSQEKLGELLGLTFQQVQKYEKGANRIGASRLFDISQILAVPVSYFFDDVPDEVASQHRSPNGNGNGIGHTSGHYKDLESGPHMMEFVSSAEGFQLIRAYTKITDPRVRKRVLDLVKSLTGDEEVVRDFHVIDTREAQRA
jgi:transcriptional regulator with XRE-family HTH domain